jgi:putative hydrolase of the HAD superfamily
VGTIRAVLFDAGNTLIRVRRPVGEVYATVARRHGAEVEGEAIDRSFRRAFLARKQGFVGGVSRPHSPEKERTWWRDLVEEVFRPTGYWDMLETRFDAFFEDLYTAFERPEHWEIFPDVLPCLDALDGRGVPTAVVSNWDSRLNRTLGGLGLLDRFRFILTSAEFGAEKPDPAIFLEAVQRLNLEPGEVLHVGDLERDDALGARNAGLQAVLIQRDAGDPVAVPCVGDLREVAKMAG